ncbi:anthranilate phosphoribosyltransferase, partial [Erwinia amylovora]|nr:anthranilate phosphoribosyltransferase [Erwinia amylovora]
MNTIVEKLYQSAGLTQAESHQLFAAISSGQLAPEQLAAALIAIKVRGETPQEIAGEATALLEDAKPFPRPDYPFADIV